MSDTFQTFESLIGNRVDRDKGVIRGVSVIEVGEAKGHGLWIDSKTLQTVKDCAAKFAEGLKVKFRHGKSGEYQNVLEETFGLLKDFVIDGNKLRADLHLLESLSTEMRSKMFEMADKMASQFGLSIVFKGANEAIDGKSYLRCTALESTDLTDKPAATSGLFSMPHTIKYESGESGKHHKDCLCGECESGKQAKKMEEFSAGLKTLTDLVGQLSAKISDTPAASVPATPGALEYKDKDGKTIQLSAEAILTRLEAADQFLADAKLSVQKAERSNLVEKIVRDGKVLFKDDGVAYKMEELQTLDLGFLKFAAKNAASVPTQARATYTSTGGGPAADVKNFTKKVRGADGQLKEVPLKGEELLAAEFETAFPSLNAAIEAQHNHLGN